MYIDQSINLFYYVCMYACMYGWMYPSIDLSVSIYGRLDMSLRNESRSSFVSGGRYLWTCLCGTSQEVASSAAEGTLAKKGT